MQKSSKNIIKNTLVGKKFLFQQSRWNSMHSTLDELLEN